MPAENFFQQNERSCLYCGNPVYGRSDKKFCDDFCRNTHNNQLRKVSNNVVRKINNALLKNRKILESFLMEDKQMVKVREDDLIAKGFQPQYHTHIYTTKKGRLYFFCYEYGFLMMAHKWYLLVKRLENN
ncbi:MAG: hypothetical protein WCY86_10510 [Spirosomataceae bacterium]